MTRRQELSASDAQQAMRVLELCSQLQQLRRAFENDPDPLALAEQMRGIDMSRVDAAHEWLTRLLVDRYAEERITLDTGKFRVPVLNPVKA
ncbi:MAG TPA: hypothetical protein VFI92_12260 [Steroidobacteraceae bacterium]|nr:hypothetical protein [Steroidobacteraceae bacterium]